MNFASLCVCLDFFNKLETIKDINDIHRISPNINSLSYRENGVKNWWLNSINYSKIILNFENEITKPENDNFWSDIPKT